MPQRAAAFLPSARRDLQVDDGGEVGFPPFLGSQKLRPFPQDLASVCFFPGWLIVTCVAGIGLHFYPAICLHLSLLVNYVLNLTPAKISGGLPSDLAGLGPVSRTSVGFCTSC